MRTFHASVVGIEEITELNTFCVVLAERVDGTGARLEIQRSLSFDERDEASGMDTYCLCSETGASHYGGVAEWTICDQAIEIILDEVGSNALGGMEGFRVSVPGSHLPELYAALQRLIGA